MSINIINIPTNINFSANYNQQLSKQLNVFLKTNVSQNKIIPLRTEIYTKDMFKKIYQTRKLRFYNGMQSER